MIHAHTDGKSVLRLGETTHIRGGAVGNPKRLKFRDVFRNRVVKRNAPFFHKLCYRDAAEAFRLRALHEVVVERNGALGGNISIACAANLFNAIVVQHDNGSRKLT